MCVEELEYYNIL